MNKKIGMIGSIINVITVLLFAIFMLFDFTFGSYFVCIFLSLSFIMMIASFENECKNENKVAGKIALALSSIYSVLILIVYFTQCTTVQNENLSNEVSKVLDYKYMGLLFNIDLLGYGIMALSTVFIGLTINDRSILLGKEVIVVMFGIIRSRFDDLLLNGCNRTDREAFINIGVIFRIRLHHRLTDIDAGTV